MSVVKIIFFIIITAILILPATACKNSSDNIKSETPAVKVESADEFDLGLTPEEFRNKYNRIAVNIDAPIMKAENFLVSPSKGNGADFICEFDSRIYLAGTMSSSGKIDALFVSTQIFSHYSVAFDSSKEIYAAVIYALSPDVGASEVWDIVKSFGQDKSNYSEYRAEKVVYGKMVNFEGDESILFMVKPNKTNLK